MWSVILLWMIGAGCNLAVSAVGFWDNDPKENMIEGILALSIIAWPFIFPLTVVSAIYATHKRYRGVKNEYE